MAEGGFMSTLTLKVKNNMGMELASASEQDEVFLVYDAEYTEGDTIVFETSDVNQHYVISIDDALGMSFVYVTKPEVDFVIPFGEKRISYSPRVFTGTRHYLTARLATIEEINNYKNLACNVMDQHGEHGCFPHATANVETRGESVFAARNAIDGNRMTYSHGAWPYESWGINRQADAEIMIDFGREVVADKIILYFRADFPHDNWWVQADFTFSDGSTMQVPFEKKVGKPHIITFEKKNITWVKMSNMIKADDPSEFPALSQIEIYGTEA